MRRVVSRSRDLLALDENLAGRLPVPAHNAVEQLAAAGAHEPVDAEDLAGLERQRHVVDRKPAGRARQADVLGAKHLGAGPVIIRLGKILGVGADHLPDDPLRVDVLHLLLAGDVAVAQHGDVVADADQLLQSVRDVDDCHALRLQVGDHLEQHLDLGCRQRRGRLVHDQNPGVERNRLGDLDQLLLADAQILDQHIGPDAGSQPVEEFAGTSLLLLVVDVEAALGKLARREDVFRDRQVSEQVELLEHHADAARDRVARRARRIPPRLPA